jgi:hypothetical protein
VSERRSVYGPSVTGGPPGPHWRDGAVPSTVRQRRRKHFIPPERWVGFYLCRERTPTAFSQGSEKPSTTAERRGRFTCELRSTEP